MPRFEWLHFYVEHVKPGVVRINNRYFPCANVVWPEEQIDHHKYTTTIAIPLENRAVLILLVEPSSARISVATEEAQLLKIERGCLTLAYPKTEGVWLEGVIGTDDIAAYMRQIGRMAVVLDPTPGSS